MRKFIICSNEATPIEVLQTNYDVSFVQLKRNNLRIIFHVVCLKTLEDRLECLLTSSFFYYSNDSFLILMLWMLTLEWGRKSILELYRKIFSHLPRKKEKQKNRKLLGATKNVNALRRGRREQKFILFLSLTTAGG